MGMKKREVVEGPVLNGVLHSDSFEIPPVPNVPTLPKTSVAPKSDPNGVSPVAPTKRPNENGLTGLESPAAMKMRGVVDNSIAGKVHEAMSKSEWRDKDDRISIDAIHKSTLESPTLANLAIGKNDDEVLALTRKFFKYQLETNQLAKRGEL